MGRRKKPPEVKEVEQKIAKFMGRKLRLYRNKKLWSLYDVEKMTGIRASSLSDYERGIYPCPMDRLKKLADLYNAPLQEFNYIEPIPLSVDVRRIAEQIMEWPPEKRAHITRAVLLYLDNIKEIAPPLEGEKDERGAVQD